jgi:hypothetical protein
MERYWDEGSQDERADVLTASAKEIGVSAGEGRQQHVVDRPPVSVTDLPDDVEVAVDDCQTAVRPNATVEAGSRSAPLHEHLADRRPCALDPPEGLDRLGQGRQGAIELLEPPTHIVPENLTIRGLRCWDPRRRLHRGRIGGRIDESAERSDPGDAIRDRVVQLHEEANAPVRETRQEPHLPQGSGGVQAASPELLARQEELRFVAGRGDPEDPDVVADIEGGGVDPQRPAPPETGPVNDLPESGKKMQPPFDVPPCGIDEETALSIRQPLAIEDGDGTDVLWPTLILGPDLH